MSTLILLTIPVMVLCCNYTGGDSNCDGVVDFKDLAILCGNWLAGAEPEL
ncbi:MAG: hypothetical protein ACYTDW_22685 [Planctomycetota bacterium]